MSTEQPRIVLPAGVEWPQRALESDDAPARSFAARVAPDVFGAIMTALLASAGAAFAIRLWEADLKSPFSYTDDGLLMLSLVKTVLGKAGGSRPRRSGSPSDRSSTTTRSQRATRCTFSASPGSAWSSGTRCS